MSKPVPKAILIPVTDKIRERVETIQIKTGIENWTEVARYALTQEYNRLVGSPVPKKK